ncbi:hypothetical protein HEK616_28980 [Streptomyces nigrescens]|uniref:Uncharacterized protein n=1 Tax=Streptomyces nigrescens TaxID=1920 RepID=A0ABN6QWT9_STRNI|nr:hypothetical protein HEK616_28980 [Streptomyces nigrescens]
MNVITRSAGPRSAAYAVPDPYAAVVTTGPATAAAATARTTARRRNPDPATSVMSVIPHRLAETAVGGK